MITFFPKRYSWVL